MVEKEIDTKEVNDFLNKVTKTDILIFSLILMLIIVMFLFYQQNQSISYLAEGYNKLAGLYNKNCVIKNSFDVVLNLTG